MRSGLRSAAGGWLLATLAACTNPVGQEPRAGTAAATSRFAAEQPLDLRELRASFGAPNQGLALNPRAVNVGGTLSAPTVKVLPGALVVPAATGAWMARTRAGDTLYCDQACRSGPFLRKIVSIEHRGSEWFARTRDGSLDDILERGWIHLEGFAESTQAWPLRAPPRVGPPRRFAPEGGASGPAETGESSKEADSDFLGLAIGAKLRPVVHASGTWTVDIVKDGWNVKKVQAVWSPSVTLGVEGEATEGANVHRKAKLFEASAPLPPVPTPIPGLVLTPSAVIEIEIGAEIPLFEIKALFAASLAGSMTVGALWDAAGVHNLSTPPSFVAEARGTTEASTVLTHSGGKLFDHAFVGVQFLLDGVAGPKIGLYGEPAVQISYKKDACADGTTAVDGQLCLVSETGVEAGISASVFFLSAEANLDFPFGEETPACVQIAGEPGAHCAEVDAGPGDAGMVDAGPPPIPECTGSTSAACQNICGAGCYMIQPSQLCTFPFSGAEFGPASGQCGGDGGWVCMEGQTNTPCTCNPPAGGGTPSCSLDCYMSCSGCATPRCCFDGGSCVVCLACPNACPPCTP